jgi:hypothetical protein
MICSSLSRVFFTFEDSSPSFHSGESSIIAGRVCGGQVSTARDNQQL